MHPYFHLYQNVLNVYQDRLKIICDPLFKIGIKYFVYQNFFIDGTSFALGLGANQNYTTNFLKYAEHYLSSITHHEDILTNNVFFEKNNKNNYVLLNFDVNQINKKEEYILHLLNEFDIWNSFVIYKFRDPTFIESYCFHMERKDLEFSQYYLNNIDNLENFCDFFSEKFKDVIFNEKRFSLDQQFLGNKFSIDKNFFQILEKFLQENLIKKIRINGHDISISKRELECLNYLSVGKSIKEIARELDLSPRTVEFYLRNLRQKSMLNKGELLREFILSDLKK